MSISNNPRKRALLIAAGFTAVTLTLVGCSGDTGSDSDPGSSISLVSQGKFICAMSGEYRPFNFIDDNNELVGIDVEVCEAIAEDLGVDAEPVTGAFNTLVAGLQSKRYDAIIGSMAVTEERKAVVDFSDAYYETGAQLFVDKGSNLKSTDDLSGANIGVTLGTTFEQHANNLAGVETVTTYQADIDALRDLANGRLDGVITQELIGLYQIKQAELNIKPVGDILYPDVAAIPVHKDNVALREAINVSLKKMQDDGRFDEIMERWFKAQP